VIVIANILTILLISIGVIFTAVTTIGILRLPDVFTRAHAASKSSTFGVLCILSGLLIHIWAIDGYFSFKLILGIAFLFITAPIGGHLMARAAYISGVKPTDLTIGDDLAEVMEKAKRKNPNQNKTDDNL